MYILLYKMPRMEEQGPDCSGKPNRLLNKETDIKVAREMDWIPILGELSTNDKSAHCKYIWKLIT